MFNYNHLYYFYSVVKEGGVSAAARKLSISQPALSAQIRQLEKFMGKKLFERQGKGLRPTEFGLMVFGHTQKMFETALELMEQLNRRGEIKGESIQVGISDDLERTWIVEFIKSLKSMNARVVQAAYVSGPSEALETKLRKKTLDVIFSHSKIEDRELVLVESFDVPVMLGVPSTFSIQAGELEMFEKGKIDPLLNEQSWGLAIPSRSFLLREETEKILRAGGRIPRIVFEGEILSAVTMAVETQQGAAFLPLPYLRKGMATGSVRVAGPQGGFWKHHIFVLSTPERLKNPSLATLVEEIREQKKNLETSPYSEEKLSSGQKAS